MDTVIEIQALSKHYSIDHKHTLKAVDDISLSINRGEIFGLVGESGCGKSTLGRLIMRLITPTKGQIIFEGQDITAMKNREFLHLRKLMQMVFQNPYASFNPKKRLGQALTEVGRYYGMNRDQTSVRIKELLSYINLSEDVLSRGPRELSGGQLQRLAIARALMTNPTFIVADEPVSALDVSVQAQLLNLLSDLRERISMTMLFISHDITVIEYLCDRVGVMYLGNIVEIAQTDNLFTEALHPYTIALIASVPSLTTRQTIALKGDLTNSDETLTGCRFRTRCQSSIDICAIESPTLTQVADGHYVACHLCKAATSFKI